MPVLGAFTREGGGCLVRFCITLLGKHCDTLTLCSTHFVPNATLSSTVFASKSIPYTLNRKSLTCFVRTKPGGSVVITKQRALPSTLSPCFMVDYQPTYGHIKIACKCNGAPGLVMTSHLGLCLMRVLLYRCCVIDNFECPLFVVVKSSAYLDLPLFPSNNMVYFQYQCFVNRKKLYLFGRRIVQSVKVYVH